MDQKEITVYNFFIYNVALNIVDEMRILSLNLLKNVYVEMIGQNRKTQFKQNYTHLQNLRYLDL